MKKSQIFKSAAATLIVANLTIVAADIPVRAQGSSGLFAGQTINLLIGFGPGGSNDAWARTIARHMPSHLPGNPNMITQNYPGAGGLRLINQLYNGSSKDGTAIGLVNRGLPLEPLLGGLNTQFDPLKMTWLGSPDRDITVCAARKDASVKSIQDLSSKVLVVGATGSGADTAIYPEFLSELLDMKFKVVKGYQGSGDILLAMERGEVEGICLAYESLLRQNLARKGQINILFQAALQADPRLKDIPIGTDLARSEVDRQVLKLFFARVSLGRPIVAPPGVDPERIAALRKAFDETMRDPEFLADADRQQLKVQAITGVEIADIIEATYKTPSDVVARTSKILGHITSDAKPK